MTLMVSFLMFKILSFYYENAEKTKVTQGKFSGNFAFHDGWEPSSYCFFVLMLQNKYNNLTAELQARCAKIEAELNLEKQKFVKLQKEFQDLHSTNTSSLATARSLELQLSETEVLINQQIHLMARSLEVQLLETEVLNQ